MFGYTIIMINHLNLQTKQKQSFQLSIKLWLPLIQAPVQELEKIFQEHSYDNPFLEYVPHHEPNFFGSSSSSNTEKRAFIENTSIYTESLFDRVSNQICAPIFPTPNSQKVAFEILSNLNHEGFFDGNLSQIAIQQNKTVEFVESIRKRFALLDPVGIAAVDIQESFLFQLGNLDLKSELHTFVKTLITNMKNMDKFHKHHLFEEAKQILKKFNSPPVIDYLEEAPPIIPDFFIDIEDDIIVRANNSYYPDIVVVDPFANKNTQLKQKLKEAKNLVNLLELRKSTLYKLVLSIAEKQISFLIGSELKPLKMAQIASELDLDESTISRAVSNKYIQCKQGIFPLKHFFTNEVSEGLSSAEIKNYISSVIKSEEKETPLTDQDLVELVKKRYSMQMVRRTITKYRKLLNIASSKDRKKIYKMG